MKRLLVRTTTHELTLHAAGGEPRVHKSALGDPGTLAREAEALEALRGEGVVGLRGVRKGVRPALVLDFVSGPTLEERIQRRLLSARELAVLATRLARILERIWAAGWVHADLKPANVLLPGGSLAAAVLVDFETARRAGERTSARATIDYAAPELLFGEQRAFPALDVFALGALLHACVTGASPFRGTSWDDTMVRLLAHEPPLLGSVPPSFAEVVASMLSKEPAARPASLHALLDRRAPRRALARQKSRRAALFVDASEDAYGAAVAALRGALASDAAAWTALRRAVGTRTKRRAPAARRLLVAELLGLPLDATERRAIAPAHADAQLLRRARQAAFVALLESTIPRRVTAFVDPAADIPSRAIFEELARSGRGPRVTFAEDARSTARAGSVDEEPPTPDAFAARHPDELARAARRFAEAGEPLRAAYYAWRAADRAFEAGDLERAHDQLLVAETELPKIRGRTPSLFGGLLHVSRARLGRWRGDVAGAAEAAQRALALLPSGSAAFCDALAERALAAGKLGQKRELVAVAGALKNEPIAEASLSWDRAASRTAVQLFYAGERETADRLVALFLERTVQPDGRPDIRRRGLSPGALVTDALYRGRLEDYLQRLLDATHAFDAVGDDRSACLYGSAVGFALAQLGAYARAERHLWAVRERAATLAIPALVALADHNLGEVVRARGRLDDAIAIESRAVDGLRLDQDRRLFAGSLAYRARMYAARGELDAALADARAALAEANGYSSLDALVHGTVAEVELALGHLPRARAAADRAHAALRPDVPTETGEALAELVFARVAIASGDTRSAREVARRACARIAERAGQIRSSTLRRSFEDRVPEHVALRRIAERGAAEGHTSARQRNI
jgi:tetratricopeptide (TPR) repeat protein